MQANNNQILFSQVSLEDLETLIKDSVKEAVLSSQKTEQEPDELFTQKEAAKFLKCTVAHLINLRRESKIKCAFLGSHPRYRKSELLEYLSNGQ